ncbi:CheF family chemotaxis protein [Haloarcula nitratireducens]|uniref:Taxis protein CheF n=1 Tax=Haloarcula nitratireducens TaxID=2487749 RepID=A0AAW4PFX7_9EURY|nr:CheF family chemotaxis protein [Halomicroarcula nitratireducens]MBX0296380.1 CheF family chemotaxis protein [Halomicroarcula nitratireducens]
MSGDERKVFDASGDFQYVVRDGEQVEDPQWRSCRIVVTNKRLVLATSGGKQPIPHSKISLADPESDVPDGAPATATAFEVGNNVLLVDAAGVEDFAFEYCRAALQGAVILARHPAVVGGVIRDDAEWGKARFRLADEEVRLQFPGGDSTVFDIEDVGTIETSESAVMGERRAVVEVEHTDERDRSVETHFSGMAHHTDALRSLFSAVVDRREDDYELSEMESQVLMALYSGVSPFEMADFVGTTPDEVEEIYQKLLDVGAVDKVRTRTEVSLNAQGRNMASEAMSGE